jgi:hypothetical protein
VPAAVPQNQLRFTINLNTLSTVSIGPAGISSYQMPNLGVCPVVTKRSR